MNLKDMLSNWDKENPRGEIVISSKKIDLAFGSPEVMGLFLPDDTDALVDANKALQAEFGGEEPRTVDMQKVATKLEFLGLSESQKEALKKALFRKLGSA